LEKDNNPGRENLFDIYCEGMMFHCCLGGGVKLQYTIYTSSYANLRNNKSSQASSDSLNLPNYNGFGREHMPLFNAIQYLASVKANASGGHMSNQRPLGKDASNISNNDGLYEVPTIG